MHIDVCQFDILMFAFKVLPGGQAEWQWDFDRADEFRS